MKRRNFLIGIGATSAGGAAVIGSGAFSRVESDRYMMIDVAEDPDAYLGLDACDSPLGEEYVGLDDDGHLYVDIGETGSGGEGVNSDSRTWFDNLIQLCNQGSDDACVWIQQEEWPTVEDGEYAGDPRVDFYLSESGESIVGEENAIEIAVGECTCLGIRTNTHGLDATAEETILEEVDDVVTLVADVDCPVTEPQPTLFEVSDLEPTEVSVDAGDTASFSATVTNAGDSSATATVSLLVDSQQATSREVTLDAGASTTVTFEADTTGMSAGDRTITIASGDSRVMGTLTVEEDDEWIQLFNGEDLEDWTPKFSGHEPGVNYNDTFTVEDGLLKVDYSEYDEWGSVFGHLFYDDEFSHYILRAEYRFVGEQAPGGPGWAFRNNGLMLHGQQPEGMDIDQDFPRSLEFQLLGEEEGTEDGRPNGDLCTPGTLAHNTDGELVTAHCWTETEGSVYEGDRWVTATAVVRGDELIQHILEDDGVVLEYQQPVVAPDEPEADADEQVPIDSGTISIQSESHPTEFRTIELKPIDPDAPIDGGDPTSPLWSSYTKEQLAAGFDEPMAIEVAPDGRVFVTERTTGNLKILDPDTGELTTALELDVYTSGEDGLQSLVLDPDFADNGWVYLYYSAPHEIIDEDSHKRLSRFTVEGDTIDPDSEVEILRVPAVDDPDYHVGGDLEFGPEGNLWISVGDDVSPHDSSGYTPIDESGDEIYDAQGTAANSNDLRGSILRISPNADGSYDVPDGNMFTGEEYAGEPVREEIYVMGCRNPFRMAVDEDGVVYWGEYGPDAGSWGAERGPPGIVEFNRAEEPGYYGWPYVVGPNLPYVDYDFATGESGEPFDPENLVNDSPHNDGLTELPTPEEPSIWYPYSWDVLLGSPPDYAEAYLPDEPPYPEFEGGAPMSGPVFDHEDDFGANALPEQFFDGTQLIGEWNEQWLRYVSYDEDGSVEAINEFMPDESFLSPMDMTIGPDGTLYLLEWGDGYADPSLNGIYRIQRTITVGFDGIEDGELVSGPGTTTTVSASVTNPFDSAIENGEVTLSAPDDSSIEVTPVEGQTFDSLGHRQAQSMSWEISIPEGTSGTHELTATVSYTDDDGEQSRTESAFAITVGRSLAGDWQFQTGDDAGWSDPAFDDSGWETVQVPDHWEDHSDYTDSEAYGWYRKTVTVPESWEGQDITLQVGMIDDVDETFVNGTSVGQTGTFPENSYSTAWDVMREYTVSSENVTYGGENVIAIRVYDGNGEGGLYEGPLLMIPASDGDDGDQTLEDGLEAHLPLDGDTPTNEVTGTDATIHGDVVTGQSGIVGDAYEFDVNQETGVEIPPEDAVAGDGVVTESLPLNGEGATAAAWINFTDHEQWARAPFQVGGAPDALTNGWDVEFSSNDDAIIPQVWQDGTPSRTGGAAPISVDPETWYFVVMVVEGGDSRLHVFDQDGELDASPRSWSGERTQTDSAPMVLGVGQGYDMAGRIDDVWAYSRALSESEAADLYELSLEGDDDDSGTDEAIEPGTAIELHGDAGGWVGLAPSSIEGETNPTLTLQEGETYELGWTEGDGFGHNIEIRDADGTVVNGLETDVVADPGDGQWLEFTASAEMAQYVCDPHEEDMAGEIDVQ